LVKHGVGTRIVTHRGPVSAHRHDTLPGVRPTTDALSFAKSQKRGSQFRSRKFVLALGRNDMVGSMGRVGAAGDNAAMESFFSLLQKNVLDRRCWNTREELRIAIVTWIERTCHRRRRQSGLGRLTPIEFEAIRSSPGAWCTKSSRDSSTGWFRRSVPPRWPPVRLTGWVRCGIC